jgi:branched-chain amino acid aminotransferase
VIYTPPTAPVLEGITRDSVITLAGDLGFRVVETPVSRDQLYIADEVFVSGTAAECIALCEIDFREIGDGKTGQVTRAIQEAFHETVRGRNPRSQGWLNYVNEGLPAGLPASLSIRDNASVS